MPPDMFVHADRSDPLEPARVINQDALTLGQDGTVRGMPGHAETGCDPGHCQVIDHDREQRPRQSAAGDLRPPISCLRCVLPPRVTAVLAPVAAHSHQQGGGPVTEWLMGEPTDNGVSHDALNATRSAPRICLNDATLDHRPMRAKVLTNGLETELIEAAERGEVRANEGSVEHVEVFRVDSVRTSIIGRPRPLSRHRRAHPAHAASTQRTLSFTKSQFRLT